MSAKTQKIKRQKSRIDPTVWVAIIGAIGTVVVAILGFPPLMAWVNNQLNPTPSITPTPSVAAVSEAPSVTATLPPLTETPLIIVQTETSIPFSPTAEPSLALQDVMNAQLWVSAYSGKAPLSVNFNAKGSYVSRPDGTTLPCQYKHSCTYRWDVRVGSTYIYGPELGGDTFSYKFDKQGEYIVVVYICSGNTCNFASASITASPK